MSCVNAVASSSKRPAPSTASTPEPTSAKRIRPSKPSESVDGDADEDADRGEEEGDRSGATLGENGEILDVDEEARAKIARKEARTIRNRESAQRSRNQRKAHLAYLEARVVELEAENRTLRGDAPASAFSPSMSGSAFGSPSAREASPAQSVISLANDLGIPTELVSGTGVKLSSVAPPPADLHLEDIKPVIPQSPGPEDVELKAIAPTIAPATPLTVASASINPAARLQAENAALRERVSLLETLVKQVVAVANLSGIHESSSAPASATSTAVEHQQELVSPTNTSNIDWAAFLSVPHVSSTTAPAAPGLEVTLSPPYYPATLADAPETHTVTQSILPTGQTPVSSSIVEATSNPIGPAAGEGGYLDVIFGGPNGVPGPVSASGSGSNKASVGGEISGSVGQAARMDYNVNIPQAFEGLFGHSQPMDWEIEVSHGTGTGQVPAQAESWDEAMRSLIEDIEGRNVRQEEQQADRSDVLGMDWFGNSEVRV
ncbi:hypothetical protein I317_03862 [Kwoniella heveanensis CBS 569]|nr:hypothetical protein I317_03862 [Kwoniella heveanensis CBS 569]